MSTGTFDTSKVYGPFNNPIDPTRPVPVSGLADIFGGKMGLPIPLPNINGGASRADSGMVDTSLGPINFGPVNFNKGANWLTYAVLGAIAIIGLAVWKK